MKNFELERLVPDIACADGRTVKANLRLNKAGRRYLIQDGSSISKGVEVLSAVNDDINCFTWNRVCRIVCTYARK
jgi:hypothetical protein